jgi:glycine cleavage system H protein
MSELKFTEDHEWVRVEDDGTATIGITDYAQQQLGDLVFVQLPEVGQEFDAGADAAAIESVKSASDLKLAVGGKVLEVNEALADEPGKVNEDPLGAGWFFKIQVSDPAPLAGLMDEAAYAEHVEGLG